MLELSIEECRLVVNALDALAKRDGLSQPQQFARSTQVAGKIQEYVTWLQQPAKPEKPEKKKKKT